MMDAIGEFINLIGDKIKIIQLGNNMLSFTGAVTLLGWLKQSNLSVTHLYLDGNMLDDEISMELGMYIDVNLHLVLIDLSNNKLSDNGIELLSQYISNKENLRCINLRGNKNITNKSTPILIDMVKSSKIEKLDVSGTQIEDMNALIPFLARNVINNGSSVLDLRERLVIFFLLTT